jgi:hypothetical protein
MKDVIKKMKAALAGAGNDEILSSNDEGMPKA